MSSFGSMAYIRVGYYKAMRSFVLNERRHLWQRLAVISAELSRIGGIRVIYESHPQENGGIKCTEQRMGICVTSDSSLEKLLQSYVVAGGNPLDISMFFAPNLSSEANPNLAGVEAATKERYPYGGVAAPVSAEYHATADYGGLDVAEMKDNESGESLTFGEFPGGFVNLISYVPRRVGGRQPATPSDEHTYMAMTIDALRGWVNQDIKEKLHMLEEKIIKLCDLSEQLTLERDQVISQAWAGTDVAMNRSPQQFLDEFKVQSIVRDLDEKFFIWVEETPYLNLPNLTSINSLVWAYSDDKTEYLLDLMFG